MNQSIRKFLSFGFVASSGRQNHNLPKVLALLYCYSIPPLFGDGDVDGLIENNQ